MLKIYTLLAREITLKRLTRLSVVVVFGTLIIACGGMNAKECLSANWTLIGLEDASKGRDISYAARHQDDCSNHDISLDMDEYREGHAEGLINFCAPDSAFAAGKRGYVYEGICPADMETSFLAEYEFGREFYLLRREVSRARNDVNNHISQIRYLDEEIDRKVRLASKLKLTERERNRLQAEIQHTHYEIIRLQRISRDAQYYLREQEALLADLTRYRSEYLDSSYP